MRVAIVGKLSANPRQSAATILRPTPEEGPDGESHQLPMWIRVARRERRRGGAEGAGARPECARDGPVARTGARDGEARMKGAAALAIVAAVSAGTALAARQSGFTRTPLQDQP